MVIEEIDESTMDGHEDQPASSADGWKYEDLNDNNQVKTA